MINREWQTVNVISFTDTVDAYGQRRTEVSGTRQVEMVCKIYLQNESDTPIYNEVEMIGITKDTAITNANQVEINNIKYNVLHTVPSRRYCQILMKKA